MPILSSNLQLRAAAVMDDTPANGGLPSSVVIVDGASNGIFPDVSEADRLGRVQFRKLYLAVDTDDTAVLMGGNSILSQVPADPDTSVVLFPAASAAETQADMVQRLGVFTGSLTQSQIDSISGQMYYVQSVSPGGVVNTGGGAVTLGAGGGMIFETKPELHAVAQSHFTAGMQITLVDFYAGAVVRAETREILNVWFPGGAVWAPSQIVLEFAAPSIYLLWGAATKFTTAYGGGEAKYGTYVIESALDVGLKKFEFYGAAVTTAAVAAGATAIPVSAVAAGIVPAALLADPGAQDVLGYPPTALTKAADGREPIFKQYRRIVIGKTLSTTGAVSNGQVVNLGEPDLSWVRVTGAGGAAIGSGFTVDLDAGTVTFTAVAGMAQPVTVAGRAEDMVQVSGVSGLTLSIPASRPLTRSYPAGSTVSAALMHGDRRARVLSVADRQTWLATWADTLAGSPASGTFDTVHHPVTVTNAGTVTDRVRLSFTNTTTFTAISENFGVLGVGSTGADFAPLNPANGKPFFSVPAAGWGVGGWSAGNQLLLDLEGAQPPLWVLRCIQMSPNSSASASFEISNRGHVDRP